MTAGILRLRQPTRDSRPEKEIPSEVATRVRPYLDQNVRTIVSEILHADPEFADRADRDSRRRLHQSVLYTLRQFWDQVENPDTAYRPLTELYHAIGRQVAHEGSATLDSLQSALHVGARTALRHLAHNSDILGIHAGTLLQLVNVALSYLDEFSNACARGYAEAESERADERARRRARLVRLLLTESPTREAIAHRAHVAGWEVPRKAAAVAVEQADPSELDIPALPRNVLVEVDWPQTYMVVPDPDVPERGAALTHALCGETAAIGPAVRPDGLVRSLRYARQALTLSRHGFITDTSNPIRCVDHASALLLHSHEELLSALSENILAPLTALPQPRQQRFAETLLCWLQQGHDVNNVAKLLYLHPQTVRYRLRQIQRILNDVADPKRHFELEIALRFHRHSPADP